MQLISKESFMARITTEDCISKVDDHFELVVVASERAKELSLGSPALVEKEGDKPSVLALRELADGKLDVEELKNHAILSFRKKVPFKETESDSAAIDAIEKQIESQSAPRG